MAICPAHQRIYPVTAGTVLRSIYHPLNVCKGPAKKAMYSPEKCTLLSTYTVPRIPVTRSRTRNDPERVGPSRRRGCCLFVDRALYHNVCTDSPCMHLPIGASSDTHGALAPASLPPSSASHRPLELANETLRSHSSAFSRPCSQPSHQSSRASSGALGADNAGNAGLVLSTDLLVHDGRDDTGRAGEQQDPMVEAGASSRGATRRHAPACARCPP